MVERQAARSAAGSRPRCCWSRSSPRRSCFELSWGPRATRRRFWATSWSTRAWRRAGHLHGEPLLRGDGQRRVQHPLPAAPGRGVSPVGGRGGGARGGQGGQRGPDGLDRSPGICVRAACRSAQLGAGRGCRLGLRAVDGLRGADDDRVAVLSRVRRVRGRACLGVGAADGFAAAGDAGGPGGSRRCPRAGSVPGSRHARSDPVSRAAGRRHACRRFAASGRRSRCTPPGSVFGVGAAAAGVAVPSSSYNAVFNSFARIAGMLKWGAWNATLFGLALGAVALVAFPSRSGGCCVRDADPPARAAGVVAMTLSLSLLGSVALLSASPYGLGHPPRAEPLLRRAVAPHLLRLLAPGRPRTAALAFGRLRPRGGGARSLVAAAHRSRLEQCRRAVRLVGVSPHAVRTLPSLGDPARRIRRRHLSPRETAPAADPDASCSPSARSSPRSTTGTPSPTARPRPSPGSTMPFPRARTPTSSIWASRYGPQPLRPCCARRAGRPDDLDRILRYAHRIGHATSTRPTRATTSPRRHSRSGPADASSRTASRSQRAISSSTRDRRSSAHASPALTSPTIHSQYQNGASLTLWRVDPPLRFVLLAADAAPRGDGRAC